MKKHIYKSIRTFVAFLHLNDRIVCEESEKRGVIDYHDYCDSNVGIPWHGEMFVCKRCGKNFYI